MSLKQQMYRNQYKFLKSILACIILIGFLFWPESPAKDYLPNWLSITLGVILALYIIVRTFFGVISIIESHKTEGRVMFAKLHAKEPQNPPQTKFELAGLLINGFYEVKEAFRNDKSVIAEIDKNPAYLFNPDVTQWDSFFLNDLNGLHGEENGRISGSLELAWGIHTQEEALETVNALWENAHQKTEICVNQLEKFALYDEAIQDFGLAFDDSHKDTNISGFDIVRFVWMVRCAYTLKYLSEEEMRNALKNAAIFVATHYQNWDELAYSYLISFIDWGHEMNSLGYSYIFERVQAVKQYLQSPHSPLHQLTVADIRTELNT